jgi:hypothetical protein
MQSLERKLLRTLKLLEGEKRIDRWADLKSCLFIYCSSFIADSIPVFGPTAVQLISSYSESEDNWQKFHPRLMIILILSLKLNLCSVQTSTSGLGTGCGPGENDTMKGTVPFMYNLTSSSHMSRFACHCEGIRGSIRTCSFCAHPCVHARFGRARTSTSSTRS